MNRDRRSRRSGSSRTFFLTLALTGVTVASAVLVGIRSFTAASAGGAYSSSLERFPLEQYEDPPATPEILARRTRSPRMIARRGSFVSVQVNVDASGNNVIGDAANEPSIAVSATDPGKIVIGWRQFDAVESNFRQAGRAYSHDAGQTWTFPGVLDPGVFRSDPVLGVDASGHIYYYSLNMTGGGYTCQLFKSHDSGVSWQGPIDAFGGDKAWMAIDRTGGIGRGNIYCVWDQWGCCGQDRFTRSTDGGLTFMDPVPVPMAPQWGTMAIGPEGEVFVAGVGSSYSTFIVARSTNARDSAMVPAFDLAVQVDLGGSLVYWNGGPNPNGMLGQVGVACDRSTGRDSGNTYLLCSADPPGSDPLDVMFARSTDGGQTWSAPTRVNDDPTDNGAWQWFGTMSVAPNGRIDVVWNDTRNTGVENLSELFYAYSSDAGLTWSRGISVSPVFDSYLGWPSQIKIGDYYGMHSDDRGASVAYAATFNEEQDVYFLRIGLADTDNDRDVDLSDFAQCQNCFSGDAGEVSADCQVCDINDDGAVSLLDVAGLTDLLGGP